MAGAICNAADVAPKLLSLRDAPVGLGEHIRALRLERGLTQVALARAAGLSATTIVNAENGHYTSRVATIWALARGLDVKAHELVADVELTAKQHRRYRDLLK